MTHIVKVQEYQLDLDVTDSTLSPRSTYRPEDQFLGKSTTLAGQAKQTTIGLEHS